MGTLFFAKCCALGFLLFFTVASTQADSVTGENSQAAGLRIIGNYPSYLQGYIVAVLTDGKVLAYGASDMGVGGDKTKRWSTLRDFNARVSEAMHAESYYQWEPKKRRWNRVEAPPECRGHRYLHTMTTLPSGKVLIAGGLCDVPRMRNDNAPYPPHTQLSLWNSTTETWERAPALATSRIFHTASLLSDGSVLIVGGESDPGLGPSTREPVLSSVERYKDGRLEEVNSLRVARARHTATTLVDGSVLVAGGFDNEGKAIADAELWDVARRVWRAISPMQTPRHSHSSTLLSDGRVMIAGGVGADGETIGSVEIWDPARNAWSAGDPMLLAMKELTTTRLANGDVLAVGTSVVDETSVLNTMLWEKQTKRWRIAGTRQTLNMQAWLPQPFTLVPYPDGSAHVFAPRSIFHWTPGQAPVSHPIYGKRLFHTTTLMADGRILLAGGQAGGWSSKESVDWVEVFDPASAKFFPIERMNQPRAHHSALALADGRVVVADGIVNHPNKPQQRVVNSPEVWNPHTGQWNLISEIRFEAEDRVYMGKRHDGTVLFFNVRVTKDGETYRPLGYRAWTWNPADGRVTQTQVNGVIPRLRAAIAVLPDGRVLIVGGWSVSHVPEVRCPTDTSSTKGAIDQDEGDGCRDEPSGWTENANATAELWDSRSGAVAALDKPPGQPMQNPQTVLLKNGQVVVTDHVPPSPFIHNPPLSSVLLWNASSLKWQQLPPAPPHQSWPMKELKDGTLATRSQRLSPGAATWTETPSVQSLHAAPEIVELPAGRLLALTTESPTLSFYDPAGSRWQLSPARDEMPRWLSKPALLPMSDGRLMTIGRVEAGSAGVDTAHIWNPRDNSWTSAGRLARGWESPRRVVQLLSGRVLHMGAYSGSHVCELWTPSDNSWTFCRTITISTPSGTPGGKLVLGTLGNGNAAILVNKEAAYVFRESSMDWVKAKLEWNNESIPYGAPVRPVKTLARLFDEKTRTWVDAGALAAEYLQTMVSPPPVILWDRKKHEWSYNFMPGRGMGLSAVMLPDGCAVSTHRSYSAVNERHWTVFNPISGEVTKHVDPGSGISQGGEFAVLADGTVVVVDSSYRTHGAMGFFHRKMGCSGFVTQANDAYLIPPESFQFEGDSTPPVQVRPLEPPWPDRVKNQIWEYRWVLLAVLGPLVIYGLLKRLLFPWGRKLRDRLRSSHRITRTVPGRAKVGSSSFRLSLRLILYGTMLVIGVPMLANIVFFHRVKLADDYATNPSAFLDGTTGILKPIPTLANKSADAAEAIIPCRYVGVWSSIQAGTIHRITLKENGRYVMAPNEYSSNRSAVYTGYWAVQGKNMIWRHEQINTTEPDINPILPDSDTRFTLIEENGKRTRYERIKAIESSTCSPH